MRLNILISFPNELRIIVNPAHVGIPFQYQSGDSCIRDCVKTLYCCHSCECRNLLSAIDGDSCIRRNDKKLKFSHSLIRRNDRKADVD
ncbi:MAG: hypothetical protein NT007_09180 [Candidatus Kapabacteria bacterium]|nr:hypothetical protein [Candidatus Kapabacteria bacterium]